MSSFFFLKFLGIFIEDVFVSFIVGIIIFVKTFRVSFIIVVAFILVSFFFIV